MIVVEGGFRPLPGRQLVYAFSYLSVGNAVAYAWARRAFRRHVVRGGTPGRQLGRDEVPESSERRGRPRLDARPPWAGLLIADLRNWVRDPLLGVAALGPFALAVVTRFGTPVATELAAPGLELEPYYPVITGAMVAFGPAIYGFVVGMFVLEDREQGILLAFRTSPLSGREYLLYRGITAYVLSAVTTLPALSVVGLVRVPPPVLVGSVAVGALGGPVIALVFGTVASNTIEGIALSKVVNLAILGPAVLIAVVPEPLQFVAGVFPTYGP